MKRSIYHFSVIAILSLGVLLGFSITDKTPKVRTDSETRSKTSQTKSNNLTPENLKKSVNQKDNAGGQNQTFGTPYYTDNFDAASDSAGLVARGYLVYRRGGPAGSTFWFTGNPSVFTAFNGATDSYVGGNFNATTGANNIDNWLVLPKKNVAVNDSCFFYSRSPLSSPYPDSIRVMYSATGDSVPEGSWVELGRFKVNTLGSWERRGFRAPTAGANARFAIRYCVVSGGPSGANSDYIGIDALTIEGPASANDVGTLSINFPPNGSAIVMPYPTIAPKATFKNFGTNNQTNIPVTYKITGPVNYTSNKSIASLVAGATLQVTFDSTFVPNTIGTYNVTVYTSAAVDGVRSNDTLRSTFSIIQPNYGSNGGYSFANSTTGAGGAPSQPGFCWVDTTGSITLAQNNVAVRTLTRGSLDDGSWGVQVGQPRKIKFMGQTYDSVYIGTNGIIGFINFVTAGNYYPPASGLPGDGAGGVSRPAIYPLWCDMDWSNTTSPTCRLCYKIDGAKNRLIITYDKAPFYESVTSGEFVSFQVILELQADTANAPNSRIQFAYSNSTTALYAPLLSGMQDASGTNYLQYSFVNSSAVWVTPGPLFDDNSDGLAVEMGPNAANLNGFCKDFNLTFRLEAIQLDRKDTVTAELRQATSPYAVLETNRGVYDSTTGTIHFNSGALNGSYYIRVSHRNSISTWSASPVAVTGTSFSYNLVSNVCQAFGCNQANVGGLASMYTGDVTGDQYIDASDIVDIYNDVTVVLQGPYLITDLNYDELVDVTDLLYCYNNVTAGIGEVAP